MRLDYALEGYWLSKRRRLSKNTQLDYDLTFRRFVEFMGPVEVEAITSRDVERFLDQMAVEHSLGAKTIIYYWTALSAFWTWAGKEMGIAHVIRGHVERPDYHLPEIVPFTQDEVRALVEACNYSAAWDRRWAKGIRSARPTALRDRAMILMMVDSGIRASELGALTVRDYDRRRGQVMIMNGKGGKPRVIYVGEACKQALWKYLAARDETKDQDPLFASDTGRPLDRHGVRKMVMRAGQRAGVRGVYPHRFRHTFAINFLRNGGDALALQGMLGHEKLDTIRIYARLAATELEKAQRVASPADNWRL